MKEEKSLKERDSRQNVYEIAIHRSFTSCAMLRQLKILFFCLLRSIFSSTTISIFRLFPIRCCMIYLFNWHFAFGFSILLRLLFLFNMEVSVMVCRSIKDFHIVFRELQQFMFAILLVLFYLFLVSTHSIICI